MRHAAPGDIRKTASAAAALAAVALTASCTSGSSAAGARPTGSTSASAATSTASADTLANDSLVSLPATAEIRVGQSSSSSSSSSTLRTSTGQPLQLQVSPSGAISLTLAMRGSGGEAFSVEGPARKGGTLADDHVVIFLSSGDLIDTEQGNPCTAAYDVLTQKHVDATYRCLTRDGAAKVVVTVHLTAGS